MKFRLSQIINGIDGELIQDGEFDTLEYCTGELEAPFLTFMENPKYISKISEHAVCVLCRSELQAQLPSNIQGIFVTDHPKEAFHQIHNLLSERKDYRLPEHPNWIDEDCQISETARIASKNVRIGKRVIIEDYVVIGENVVIGDDCIIHSGAVIGGKAFTFARGTNRAILGLADLGQVIIGDRVEIFSLTHIAKGILPTDKTVLGADCKLDALVYIGHGAKIGERTLVAGSALVAGNCKVGKDAWIGVNATVSNRIVVGNSARVSLGAVVTKNVRDGETVTGNFAIEHEKFIQRLKDSVKDEN